VTSRPSVTDAPAVLQAVDETLDPAAQRVEAVIDRVLDLAVALGRDLRGSATVAGVLPNRVAVVPVVGEQHARGAVPLLDQIGVGGGFVGPPRRQHHTDR
jgi:hypothetical protein